MNGDTYSTRPVIHINNKKTIDFSKKAIKNIEVKGTNTTDIYLHSLFKYCNQYNLYISEDGYHNKSIEQLKIAKHSEDKKINSQLIHINSKVEEVTIKYSTRHTSIIIDIILTKDIYLVREKYNTNINRKSKNKNKLQVNLI